MFTRISDFSNLMKIRPRRSYLLRKYKSGRSILHDEFYVCYVFTAFLLIFIFILFYFILFLFLGPHVRHMEVPRLGVKLEL